MCNKITHKKTSVNSTCTDDQWVDAEIQKSEKIVGSAAMSSKRTATVFLNQLRSLPLSYAESLQGILRISRTSML